jgi:hypothetical protein
MKQDRQPREANRSRYFHEIFFSLNVAFASMTVVLASFPHLTYIFSRMESSINLLSGIRQTDYIRGYFAIFIPSLILALAIWAVLRLSWRTRPMTEILRSVAGVVALFALPAFWFYTFQYYGWPFGWPYRGAPFELGLALVCTLLFISGKWSIRWWLAVLLLAGHYTFFWVRIGGNYSMPNYAGPIAPILSFASAAAWVFDIRRLPPPESIDNVPQGELIKI